VARKFEKLKKEYDQLVKEDRDGRQSAVSKKKVLKAWQPLRDQRRRSGGLVRSGTPSRTKLGGRYFDRTYSALSSTRGKATRS